MGLLSFLFGRRELCDQPACPRKFKRKDCSEITCPLAWGGREAIKIYMLDANDEAQLVATRFRSSKMKNCTCKVSATNGKTGADEFYWAWQTEYRNLGQEGSDIITSAMAHCEQNARRIISGKADDGLIAMLEATVDGVAKKPIKIPGMSYSELAQLQHEALGFGMANAPRVHDHAKKKDDEREARRHGGGGGGGGHGRK